MSGTVDEDIHYKKVEEPSLVGYSDSDWFERVDASKSTSGYVCNIDSEEIHDHRRNKKSDIFYNRVRTYVIGIYIMSDTLAELDFEVSSSLIELILLYYFVMIVLLSHLQRI